MIFHALILQSIPLHGHQSNVSTTARMRLIYAHFIHTAKCNQKCLAIFWIESFVARSFGKYDRKQPRQPA